MGAFEMYEVSSGLATIDYHIHRQMDETIYAVEAEIEFTVAGEEFLRPAGSVAFRAKLTPAGTLRRA
jgi:uncharacterized cupin superfamily protein